MRTEVDLYNAALAELGQETQITDANPPAPGRQLRVLKSLMPTVRDAIMREHPWLCLSFRRTLSKLDMPIATDWQYPSAFRLPARVERVWAVGTDLPWTRGFVDQLDGDGNLIARRDCILSSGDGPVRVVTIENLETQLWDAALFNAVAIALASRAAGPLNADKALRKDLLMQANAALMAAVTAETSEWGNEGELFPSYWLAARWGSEFGDAPIFVTAAPAPVAHGHL